MCSIEKIQGTYFKISALYFKISQTYFLPSENSFENRGKNADKFRHQNFAFGYRRIILEDMRPIYSFSEKEILLLH